MVPRAGLEPARRLTASRGFSCPPRLSPPRASARVRGLECALTLAAVAGGGRPPPSTLYTFPARAGLGSALPRRVASGGSPTLTGFTPGVSDPGAQSSSPLCLPVSPPGLGGSVSAARRRRPWARPRSIVEKGPASVRGPEWQFVPRAGVGREIGPQGRAAPLMSPAPGFARRSSFTSLHSTPHRPDRALRWRATGRMSLAVVAKGGGWPMERSKGGRLGKA